MKKGARAVKFRLEEAALLALVAVLVMGVFISDAAQRSAIASSETTFVEHSIGGMQIVPASCPSDPHYAGQCDGELPSSPNCYLNASDYNIDNPGEIVTLSWGTSAPAGHATWYANGVVMSGAQDLPVPPTQVTRQVSPTINTTYRVRATWDEGISDGESGYTVTHNYTCSATVTIGNGQCVPSFSCNQDSTGIRNSCTGAITLCPVTAPHCSNGQCICPVGWQGCDAAQCPVGQHRLYPADPNSPCVCDATNALPDSNGQCRSCTEYYYCSGNDRRVNNSCTGDRRVEACDYICAGGSCIAFPPPSGYIEAHPSLVRSGRRTDIEWETEHTTSCTVTENNSEINDSWTGRSGEETSSPLDQQTIYTLRCVGRDGSDFVDTATVNIIPVWEEQ